MTKVPKVVRGIFGVAIVLVQLAVPANSAVAKPATAVPGHPCGPPVWAPVGGGCRVDSYAYFAVQLPPGDPGAGLNDNAAHMAAGPMIALAVASSRPGKTTQLELRSIELVDGHICQDRQWALVRTPHAEVVKHVKKCTATVKPTPAAKGCPSWARPHSEVATGILLAVTGVPLEGRSEAKVRAIAEDKVSVLLPMSGHSKSTSVAAAPTDSSTPASLVSYMASSCKCTEDDGPKDEVVVCGETLWLKRMRKRLRTPKCP